MEKISLVLLTFLLNAGWQVALIAAVAALCAWLLRAAPARDRHLLWVAALALCFFMPILTCVPLVGDSVITKPQPSLAAQPDFAGTPEVSPDNYLPVKETTSFIPINGNLAAGLGALYLVFLGYRAIKLFRAWRRTRAIARSATPTELVRTVLEKCKTALGVKRGRILSSPTIPVPVTVGSLDPLIILPEPLLREGETEVLTAAIGHELIHVLRRDYAINLLYELIYLPLSFHPVVALVRRRINQTRELRCDELVAERLLNAEAYARSLVQLASSALPQNQRAVTITVGIADADILEVRIMSLLRKTKLNVRRNRLLVIAAALLLAVPCVAAASFAFQFNVNPQNASLIAQLPPDAQESQEKGVIRERRPREMKEGAEREREEREMKERAARDPQFRAELEARERHMKEEQEIMAKRQIALARAARVTMDQAIQYATNQHPGKVLQCNLIGKGWESPTKLASDSQVFYHIVILTGDEADPATTHVFVNAIDGNLFQVDKRGTDR